MYQLYGDGIHDDTLAIQEMLDSRLCEIALPVPQQEYRISKTLKIHSGQTLRLPTTARIRLADHSDCLMLTNAETGAQDIAVIGGIWDYNNLNQHPNPSKTPGYFDNTHHSANPDLVMKYDDSYQGIIIRFCGVTRLTVRGLTLKDPVTYCLQLACVTHFTVEDLYFDQNDGNPTAENMDGVHLDGYCRFGLIRNVQGTCYDDVVALNCNDFYDGPITDIQIDGIFGKNSLRGVRLLSTHSELARISISNIFGTFYQNITIRNVYASNAPRREVYNKKGPYTFSMIWVDADMDVKNLVIENVFRHETIAPIETLHICPRTEIDMVQLSHIDHDNQTGTPVPAILNEAHIEHLYLHDVRAHGDEVLVNKGQIDKIN